MTQGESGRYFVVAMPDGNRWGVPAEIIARNKAECYAKISETRGEDAEQEYKEEFEAMIYFFDTKNYEFADWAKGNMNWDDVEEYAFKLPDEEKKMDWEEGWMNGEYEYMVLKKEGKEQENDI